MVEVKNSNELGSVMPHVKVVTNFLATSLPAEDLPNVDAIFVFGHYEPQVAHHAADLWKKGKAPYIVISGKGRDAIPEGFETEADFYSFLIESDGVSKKALILEKKATNSLENVRFGIPACRNAGINPASIILCAMPPLLRRSRATFKKQFPEITLYNSGFPMPEEWFTPRRVNRLLGELERLEKYAEKGDVEKTEIPDEVISAAEKIRRYMF